jgi:hypothetical protein
LCEFGVFTEETITRVDHVDVWLSMR